MKDERGFVAEGVTGNSDLELEAEALRMAQEAFSGDVVLAVLPVYLIRRSGGIWPIPDDPSYKKFVTTITVKVCKGDEKDKTESPQE